MIHESRNCSTSSGPLMRESSSFEQSVRPWEGDWRQRLLRILSDKGYGDLSTFAKAHPLVTLEELASLLSAQTLAPVQLEWQLINEASARGSLRYALCDLLVRQLRRLPTGWPSGNSWEAKETVRSELVAWMSILDDVDLNERIQAIAYDLLDSVEIPPSWIPKGVDDPRIAGVFEKHWPADEGTHR